MADEKENMTPEGTENKPEASNPSALDDVIDDEEEQLIDLLLGNEEEGEEGTQENAATAAAETSDGLGATPEAEEKPEEAPPSDAVGGQARLSGEALLRAFASDPEAQALARQQLTAYLEETARQVAAAQRKEEFDKLIEEGRYEEIGRRFVEASKAAEVRSAAEEEAVRAVYANLYGELFRQPELQNLSETDRSRLAPGNYPDDASYVTALMSFIAEKRSQAALAAEVDKRVKETLEALKNMNVAQSVTRPSPSSVPPGAGAAGGPETPEALIAEGWAEILKGEE